MTTRQDRHADAHRRMLVAVSLSKWSEAAEAAREAALYCTDARYQRRLREKAATYGVAQILKGEAEIDAMVAETAAR